MKIQTLWIGDSLSRMEQGCLRSWLKHNYEVDLYVYEQVGGIPDGVNVLDANSILPANKIFRYSFNGSVAGFANQFRYKLLDMYGGIWFDTDVYLLKPLPEYEYLFVRESEDRIANCILKAPIASELAKQCFKACEAKDVEKLYWGETGPVLVTELISKLGLTDYVQLPEKFFPIMYNEIHRFVEDIVIPDAYAIHFWSASWKARQMDTNKRWDENSIYEQLMNTGIA
jgi:mannosyltransferase OCH1-like enzyme